MRAEGVVAQAVDLSRRKHAVPTTRSRPRDDALLRYCLDVVASTVTDVVRSAGGWLYDRAMAGWEVNVLVAQQSDTRPLQILGVNAVDLEGEFASMSRASAGRCLAVGADVFASDACVRDTVLEALGRCLTEVTLFHDDRSVTAGHRMTVVQHVLSSAARVFKGHALAAAGVPDNRVGPTETLLNDMKTCLPVDSELIPLS